MSRIVVSGGLPRPKEMFVEYPPDIHDGLSQLFPFASNDDNEIGGLVRRGSSYLLLKLYEELVPDLEKQAIALIDKGQVLSARELLNSQKDLKELIGIIERIVGIARAKVAYKAEFEARISD